MGESFGGGDESEEVGVNRLPATNGDAHVIDLDVVGLKARVEETLRRRFSAPIPAKPETPKRFSHAMMFSHRGPLSLFEAPRIEEQLVASYQAIAEHMARFGVEVKREDFALRFLDSGKTPDGLPACRFLLEWAARE